MAHMSLQNSQIPTNDGGNGGVRDQQHQDNTPESLKTEPDDHLLPILSSSGHNYAVQVRSECCILFGARFFEYVFEVPCILRLIKTIELKIEFPDQNKFPF